LNDNINICRNDVVESGREAGGVICGRIPEMVPADWNARRLWQSAGKKKAMNVFIRVNCAFKNALESRKAATLHHGHLAAGDTTDIPRHMKGSHATTCAIHLYTHEMLLLGFIMTGLLLV
jgi:hypothetical protein